MASTSQLPYLPASPVISAIAGAEPGRAVIDAFKTRVADTLAPIIGKKAEEIYPGVEASGLKGVDIKVALPRFRLGGKPEEWAKKVVDAFQPDEYLSKVEAIKGFLQYSVNRKTLSRAVLAQIRSHPSPDPSQINAFDKHAYGCMPNVGKGKKVIVEFSSPNIAKPFHAGHLRSTIIGAFLGNLYEFAGWEVVRMNYLGDWGKQFGLLAVGFERHGTEQQLEEDAIKHLFDVYVKVNQDKEAESLKNETTTDDLARLFFKNLENGDAGAVALWTRFRDLSINKYKETYGRLNIRFDVYSGESQVQKKSMEDALDRLQEMGVVVEKEGALIAELDQWKLESTVVRKKDGTTIYITRDIGAAQERKVEYQFDKMVYVVASQQNLHLAQFFKVLELMGYDWAKDLEHITFGMVLGMSTRKGTVKFLNDILEESSATMMEQMLKNEEKYAQIEDPQRCADTLGISAVKIQDFSGKRKNDYKFDIARMCAFEGDTGVYLQYAHVRLSSIERKNPNVVLPADCLGAIDTSLLTEDKAHDIIFCLALFPEVVSTAYQFSEPSAIVTYLFRLAHAISTAWDSLRVQNVEPELALARLYMFICARDVLGAGMRLLTLSPLDRM